MTATRSQLTPAELPSYLDAGELLLEANAAVAQKRVAVEPARGLA